MAKNIPLRRRIFIGCEGASERSYIRWLQGIADSRGKHLFFDAHDVGGGDPLSIVEASVDKLKRQETNRGKFADRAILLDADRIGDDLGRDQTMYNLVRSKNITLIPQDQIHEAVLLRHFPGCEQLRPAKNRTIARLRKEWKNYDKPADAMALRSTLQYDDFRRMLTVETDFRNFFTKYLI